MVVWLGDCVCCDVEGLFYFGGCCDVMIKSVGNCISLQEIEEVVFVIGFVVEVVVFGIFDEWLGYVVYFVVCLFFGYVFVFDELIYILYQELFNFMLFKVIYWCEVMLIGLNGKIDCMGLQVELIL